MSWQDEYKRALEKANFDKDVVHSSIVNAEQVLDKLPLPYRSRLELWLKYQSRDDFMVHGGVWEDLINSLFLAFNE